MPHKLIIDCDPGQDDALMLFLGLSAPEALEILGIVTVAGNVELYKTQRNARMICEIAGRTDIPVYAGYDRPLLRPLEIADYVHGHEGVNGLDIFEPAVPLQKQHGVDYIIETLLAAEENEITIVPTGPLTNIAHAIQREPQILPKIKNIVLMGGAMREGGNITPSAEYNIYVDPHAAQIVFRCGRPIIAMGLDVTHQIVATLVEQKRLARLFSPVAKAAHALIEAYAKFDQTRYGIKGAILHDPCTIAYLLDPDLFEVKLCNIEIETEAVLTFGHTAVDFWNLSKRPSNAYWVYKCDRHRFFDLFIDHLSRYEAVESSKR